MIALLKGEDTEQIQGIWIRRVGLQHLAIQGLGFLRPTCLLLVERPA
jgi:hypothetical protein